MGPQDRVGQAALELRGRCLRMGQEVPERTEALQNESEVDRLAQDCDRVASEDTGTFKLR